jgi:ABC-type uncharacterized transport system substrate-binding protein
MQGLTPLARALVVLGLLAVSLSLEAQTPTRVRRVGVLSPGNPPPADAFHQRERFEAGLRELGWVPGSNIVIDYRYAEGKLDRLPALATELVRIPVEVIVARGLTIAAARQATSTIPIVMAADPDPVRSGFVASLARPGGTITGLSTQALDLEVKQLELLREVFPRLARVAILTNAKSPDSEQSKRIEPAAQALRFDLVEFPIGGPDELPAAFAAIKQAGMGAILFRGTLWFLDANQVAGLIRKHGVPTIHNLREFVDAGAVMSYGVDFAELHRRAAVYVDKILKGARPGELPVEQPTKFALVINLKAAKALGLTIPQSVLARADAVIQ